MGSICRRAGYQSIGDVGASTSTCCTSRRLVIVATVVSVLLLVLTPLIRPLSGVDDGNELALLASESLLWKRACLVGLQDSGFAFLDTENYNLWYNDDSVMQLAQSGQFKGPEQMIEYVEFTKSTFFESYESLEQKRVPISTGKDQCQVLVAVQNRAQVKPEYSTSGEGVCLITTVGFKLYYTVNNLKGDGFLIQRTNLFYPDKFLNILFNDGIGGDNVTDYICDDVLRDNCPKVYEENGLNEEKCKSMYNSLPPTDGYGYLDEYTKGCRILHSAFAEINEKHCPHMSFIPIPDYTGTLWCQTSGGVKAEDLFTPYELGVIKEFAINSGFDPITLSANCTYTPNGTA